MTKNNEYIIPKVEIVSEVKDEYKIPSFEEFVKTYEGNVNYDDLWDNDISEVRGYGPCKNSNCDCSCSCSGFGCRCRCDLEMWMGESSGERYGVIRSSGEGKVELSKAKIKNSVSVSVVSSKTSSDEASLLTLSTGGAASLNKDGLEVKANLGVNLVSYENRDFQARLGLNVDTGGSITNDGIEGKFLGFGVSIGKKTGISTPLGEIKLNTDDCVIQ